MGSGYGGTAPGDSIKTGKRDKYQVGLEFGQIDVEGAVESERGRDGTDDLGDESVQVGVCRPGEVEVSPANVVDCLVVDHKGTVAVL